MAARMDHAVVSGTFSLNSETHEVDDNVWVVGEASAECVVIDAPHSCDILALVGDRTVRAILCTRAHDRPRPASRPRCARRSGRRSWCAPDDQEV